MVEWDGCLRLLVLGWISVAFRCCIGLAFTCINALMLIIRWEGMVYRSRANHLTYYYLINNQPSNHQRFIHSAKIYLLANHSSSIYALLSTILDLLIAHSNLVQPWKRYLERNRQTDIIPPSRPSLT